MNNLPIKKSNNIIIKIKEFIYNFFSKNKKSVQVIQVKEENVAEKKDILKDNNIFKEEIKCEVKNEFLKEKEREEFAEKITKNPNLLYELPVEKLVLLNKYYDELIFKEEQKLAKLKKAN